MPVHAGADCAVQAPRSAATVPTASACEERQPNVLNHFRFIPFSFEPE